ncbi:MAG: hypothetical protein Q9159_006130, partial [Coniocarpon cinnabarinum]
LVEYSGQRRPPRFPARGPVFERLSHRTGWAWDGNLYYGTDDNVLIEGKDSMKYVVSHHERLLPFRGQLNYNSFDHELAGHVIEKLTGSPRTELTTERPPRSGVQGSDNGLGGASGGMRTYANDSFKFYRALLNAGNHQFAKGTTLPGALALAIFIPDTESALLALTNSLALNDIPDWVGQQLVLEELQDVPVRNDYIKAAETRATGALQWYPSTIDELKKAQKNGTSPRNAKDYIDTYWDQERLFQIKLTGDGGALFLGFSRSGLRKMATGSLPK